MAANDLMLPVIMAQFELLSADGAHRCGCPAGYWRGCGVEI
ncbi:MAG: hypothetical protein WBL25_19610 [Anaerolineales bacterium]